MDDEPAGIFALFLFVCGNGSLKMEEGEWGGYKTRTTVGKGGSGKWWAKRPDSDVPILGQNDPLFTLLSLSQSEGKGAMRTDRCRSREKECTETRQTTSTEYRNPLFFFFLLMLSWMEDRNTNKTNLQPLFFSVSFPTTSIINEQAYHRQWPRHWILCAQGSQPRLRVSAVSCASRLA